MIWKKRSSETSSLRSWSRTLRREASYINFLSLDMRKPCPMTPPDSLLLLHARDVTCQKYPPSRVGHFCKLLTAVRLRAAFDRGRWARRDHLSFQRTLQFRTCGSKENRGRLGLGAASCRRMIRQCPSSEASTRSRKALR